MAPFKTQFEILTQVRRVVYTGTNQVITTFILRLAHTAQYVIENWEEPGNEAGYYNSIMLTYIWQPLLLKTMPT